VSQQPPLYERDPVAWQKHLAEGNAKQPRKRVGCDVLLRDTLGRILIVNPEYKPDWDLPGGMAEANESPLDAVQRELREELGLRDVHLRRWGIERRGSQSHAASRS
jgi:8-oxo-dGTP diphosphatase